VEAHVHLFFSPPRPSLLAADVADIRSILKNRIDSGKAVGILGGHHRCQGPIRSYPPVKCAYQRPSADGDTSTKSDR